MEVDMSTSPNLYDDKVKTFIYHCLELYIQRADIEEFEPLIADDAVWIGIGADEYADSRDGVINLLQKKLTGTVPSRKYTNSELKVISRGNSAVCLGWLQLSVNADEALTYKVRFSVCVTGLDSGDLKIQSLHVSLPQTIPEIQPEAEKTAPVVLDSHLASKTDGLEESFQVAAAQEGIYVWTINLDTMTQSISSSVTRMYEVNLKPFRSLAEYCEQTIEQQLCHPDDVSTYRRMFKLLLDGAKNVTCIVRFRNKLNRQWDWLRISYNMSPFSDADRKRLIGSATEVNSLMKAQQKYYSSLNYRLFAQRDAIATFTVNLSRNLCLDCRCRVPPFSEIDQTQGLDYFFKQLADDIPEGEERTRFQTVFNVQMLLSRFKDGENSIHFEFRYFPENSRPVWRRSDIELLENPDTQDVEAFIYTFDIDYIKNQQLTSRYLIRMDYEFIGLIDTVNQSLITFTRGSTDEISYDQRISDYHEALLRLLDLSPEESASSEAYVALNLEKIKDELSAKDTYVYTMQTADSETGKKQLKGWKCFYMPDYPKLIIITCTDVTETFENEQAQKDLLFMALQQAQQATIAKSTFLSNMSHEIRSPLNAIIGTTTLALQGTENEVNIMDSIKRIDVSAKFLLSLINDILDISRIESGTAAIKHEKFSFAQLIDGIDVIIKPQAAAKGITYESRFIDEIDSGYIGDQTRLQQILINIIGNAIKYTPSGGSVTMTIDRQLISKTEARLRFVIMDTGIGISREFLPHIFEPFRQEHSGTTTNYGGTGLGLAISKNIVEMMGGTIVVQSTQGVGTTFAITVMLEIDKTDGKQADSVEEKVPDAKPETYDFSGKRVLLCEDHPLNIDVARHILEHVHFTVDVAENGLSGVEQFMDHDNGWYDCILMDIRMPIMDGLTATEKIRGAPLPYAKTVPIIAMSANAFSEDVEKSLSAGMNAHLAKPIELDILYSTLKRYIK